MIEKTEKPQITGEQIRNLRRKQGMSPLGFARALGVPVWLVEILGQEQMDDSDQLSQFIPETMRSNFYQMLVEEYGQPETWFIATSSSSAQESLEGGKELTLSLPITVSPQTAMEWMDIILLLFNDDLSCANLKERCANCFISDMMQLHQLYCRVWRMRGYERIAQENSMLLKTRIHQKMRELEAV